MKNKFSKTKTLIATGLILLVLGFVLILRIRNRMASSGIGIIGGADYPTLIFIIKYRGGWKAILLFVVGLISTAAGIFISIRNKNKD